LGLEHHPTIIFDIFIIINRFVGLVKLRENLPASERSFANRFSAKQAAQVGVVLAGRGGADAENLRAPLRLIE
jgi:hypothetical protein